MMLPEAQLREPLSLIANQEQIQYSQLVGTLASFNKTDGNISHFQAIAKRIVQ
jgi:hypothetical protein